MLEEMKLAAEARGLPPHLTSEPTGWVTRLTTDNGDRDAAMAELHALLLKATRFEVDRRSSQVSKRRDNDPDDLARQSADDALVAILKELGDFRGQSRFTTWACKFAIVDAATKVRRRSSTPSGARCARR